MLKTRIGNTCKLLTDTKTMLLYTIRDIGYFLTTIESVVLVYTVEAPGVSKGAFANVSPSSPSTLSKIKEKWEFSCTK